MKTIGRIIIILVAALVVVGVTLAITNSAGASQSTGRFSGGEHIRSNNGNFVPGRHPEGGFDREHGGGGSVFGSLLMRFVMVSIIVLIFLVIERIAGRIRKKSMIPVPIKEE
jgi:uncharacterized membrane protein